MSQFRISRAAQLLGVSDGTVRRWLDAGYLPLDRDHGGRMVIDGARLAAFVQSRARPPRGPLVVVERLASNRFVGLVTSVIADTKMTQIKIQCGSCRVVSLMSTDATSELDLAPGSLAVAVVKPTNVIIETLDG
ncbi:MAG: TOBE domain-containing protein [Pseudonocardiaceae bacterium]